MLRIFTRRVATTHHQCSSAANVLSSSANTPADICDRLENGTKIYCPNAPNAPIQISAIFKAGSRHEESSRHELGLNHIFRRSVGLSNEDNTAITTTRSLQQMGASVNAISNREHLTYRLQLNNMNWLEEALQKMNQIMYHTNFYQWELGDVVYKHIFRDLEFLHRRDFNQNLLELLHSAAYKDNKLGNSLYAPAHIFSQYETPMLGEGHLAGHMDKKDHVYKFECLKRELFRHLRDLEDYTLDTIVNYRARHINNNALTLVALGGGHTSDEWFNICRRFQSTFSGDESSLYSQQADDVLAGAAFIGGESRFPVRFCGKAKVALAWEGLPLGDDNEVTLNILGFIIGQKAPSNASGHGVLHRCLTGMDKLESEHINLAYKESGLFGVYLSGTNAQVDQSIPLVLKEMKALAVNGVNEKDLAHAKMQLKCALLYESESPALTSEKVGQRYSLLDISSFTVNDVMAKIDALTVKHVNLIANKVLNSKKIAMSSVGDIHGLPYVNEVKELL